MSGLYPPETATNREIPPISARPEAGAREAPFHAHETCLARTLAARVDPVPKRAKSAPIERNPALLGGGEPTDLQDQEGPLTNPTKNGPSIVVGTMERAREALSRLCRRGLTSARMIGQCCHCPRSVLGRRAADGETRTGSCQSSTALASQHRRCGRLAACGVAGPSRPGMAPLIDGGQDEHSGGQQ